MRLVIWDAIAPIMTTPYKMRIPSIPCIFSDVNVVPLLFEGNDRYGHCYLNLVDHQERRDKNLYHAPVCDLGDVGHKVSWPMGIITTRTRAWIEFRRPMKIYQRLSLIARFMVPTWGPSGVDRTQVGPMLAPWTLLSGMVWISNNNNT